MKFYNKKWFIVLMLFVFPPLGITLIWTSKTFKQTTSIVLSVVFGFYLVVMLSQSTKTPTQQKQSQQLSTTNDPSKIKTPKPPTTIIPTPTPILLDISAETLCMDYTNNAIKANTTYKGKVANITGTIVTIDQSLGSTYITLSSGKEFDLMSVQCFFKDKTEIAKLANFSKGENITVVGRIEGVTLLISVKDCKVK